MGFQLPTSTGECRISAILSYHWVCISRLGKSEAYHLRYRQPSNPQWSGLIKWPPGCLVFSVYIYMGVSKNNGTPKSSILIGFPIIFTIHFGGFSFYCWKHPYGDEYYPSTQLFGDYNNKPWHSTSRIPSLNNQYDSWKVSVVSGRFFFGSWLIWLGFMSWDTWRIIPVSK